MVRAGFTPGSFDKTAKRCGTPISPRRLGVAIGQTETMPPTITDACVQRSGAVFLGLSALEFFLHLSQLHGDDEDQKNDRDLQQTTCTVRL